MQVMLVLDHPYGAAAWQDVPHQRSLTSALAHAARNGLERAGHEVDLVDLHADSFDPVMSAEDLVAWRAGTVVDRQVADYQRRLMAADHLVFAFPVWWESMPALTKGFFDKVLGKGIVYRQSSKGLRPMAHRTRLTGVTLVTVMSTPTPVYRTVFGNPMTKIVFRGTFRKIGVRNLTWLNHGGLDRKTAQHRRRAVERVERHFAALT